MAARGGREIHTRPPFYWGDSAPILPFSPAPSPVRIALPVQVAVSELVHRRPFSTSFRGFALLDTMEIHDVLKLLPHRYPFLLVDRVLEYKLGDRLVALKNVSYNEPFFTGHFPRRPVMPGVLIVEALAQATGLLAMKTSPESAGENSLYYFVGIDKARFKRPVEPGDQLILDVTLKGSRRGIWMFTGKATVDDKIVCTAELMCTARDFSVIHPTAIIDATAVLADDVEIGAYSVIGAGVEIGRGTRISPHVVIKGPTRIGEENEIYQFASIGDAPQDKKYADEPTRLEIGNRNVIREFATLNRGTEHGGGVTRIGDDNLLMAYIHVAHDCQLGDDIIMANAASLGGHVVLEDQVILGGFAIIHQFCRIGAHSFCGMGSAISKDVPPYVMVSGNPAKPHGINAVGLKRRGFSAEAIQNIRSAYRALYRSGLRLDEAIVALQELAVNSPEVELISDFLDHSDRSILR